MGTRTAARWTLLAVLTLSGCHSATLVPSEAMTDVSIAAAVQRKLLVDDPARFNRLNVESRQGVVKLTGFVDSDHHRINAGESAREIEGVVRVENNLEVQSETGLIR